jgi:hypothetical protein
VPRSVALQLIACVAAALAPFATRVARERTPATGAVVWPTTFEGRALVRLPLGPRDERFARDFPGQIARFHDGRRELILRHIMEPTRRLHPASDCLRAVGFSIDPLPARRAPDGTSWGCFAANRAPEHLTVCEQIRDAAGHTWPDASSWYWPALAGSSAGPWWSTTVVEPL